MSNNYYRCPTFVRAEDGKINITLDMADLVSHLHELEEAADYFIISTSGRVVRLNDVVINDFCIDLEIQFEIVISKESVLNIINTPEYKTKTAISYNEVENTDDFTYINPKLNILNNPNNFLPFSGSPRNFYPSPAHTPEGQFRYGKRNDRFEVRDLDNPR